MRNKVILAVICVALMQNVAYAVVEDNAVVHLIERLENIQSLKADFTQVIKDEKGELLQQSNGELLLKKPRKLYWRTNDPYQHLVVTDGKELWIYDIDLEQASLEPFSASLDQAPALLLSGDIKLISKRYHVHELSKRQGEQRFQLTPLTDDSMFKSLILTFEDMQLRSMVLSDSFEQHTEILFSGNQLNSDISDERFHFIPPKDIDVIRNES